jgi:hypothetical protein
MQAKNPIHQQNKIKPRGKKQVTETTNSLSRSGVMGR